MKKCIICGNKTKNNYCFTCSVNIKREKGKLRFIERLYEKYPTFEYICGNPNNDGKVVLKCKICGNTFQRCANMVRHKKHYRCNNCYKQNKLIEAKIKEQDNYLNKKKIDEIKEINFLYKRLIKDTILIKHCLLCGVDITDGSNKKYCSICKKHIVNKNRSDTKIPLKRLYERDKGICYLCGSKCDLEDYVYKGNVFIAGNYYPSVEHIIPRAKGGTDTWDNVKLAHRICNSLKGINPPRW